ncbi:MAG TPA: MaoC/PaaZ C-terminal domain-containing protein [Acidimicrobiales bacterium]|nr:MaoC/PaaZ C-terminal domain-containing protein [Acidimicrobiales bacterium]
MLCFEDVKVGDTAPVLAHQLTRADLVEYAAASGDFNPMHTDEVAAKEAGMSGVFGHGMLSAGLLATALTNWAGIGRVVRYRVRFVKQAWPGEDFRTAISVTGKRNDGGRHLVDVECSLANADGEVKVSGDATVELPSRG